MTDAECQVFEGLLDKNGFYYNIRAAVFMTKPTDTKDSELVEWYEVLLAVPQFSLNDLEAYEGWKQRGETATTTTIYSFADADLGENEVSADDAEAMRTGDWQEASDLPDGVEYAPAVGQDGRPGRLHRVANP